MHVVGNPQAGAVVVGAVLTGGEGALKRTGTERRTADAEQQHVLETLQKFFMNFKLMNEIFRKGKRQEGKNRQLLLQLFDEAGVVGRTVGNAAESMHGPNQVSPES